MNLSKFHMFVENLSSSLLTVLKVLLMSKWFVGSCKIVKKNNDCLILGNGPSLKKSLEDHQAFFVAKDLVCVNHFAESDMYAKLKPNIYILGAPEMWIDDVNEAYLKKGEKLFKAITENTKWELHLYLYASAKKSNRWQSQIKLNPFIHVHYYNPTPIKGFPFFINYCFKNNLGMARPHNVLIPSLMISVNLAYKNIYLFGADHSWMKELHVTWKNEVLLTQKHFYDEKTAMAKPMDKLGKEPRKLHEVLIKWYHAFSAYFIIDSFAKKQKVKILNATPNSFIDAFERIEL